MKNREDEQPSDLRCGGGKIQRHDLLFGIFTQPKFASVFSLKITGRHFIITGRDMLILMALFLTLCVIFPFALALC